MDPFGEIQNTIQQVLPIVLIAPGIVLVGAGLFMWLGGLRWLKSLAAFSAALAGLLCAWFFTDRQFALMILLPVILAGLGVFFHKIIVVVLGGLVAAMLVIFVPVMAGPQEPKSANQPQAVEQQFDLLESVEWAQAKIEQIRQRIKEAVTGIPQSRKMAAIAAVVIIGLLGLWRWRLICAATCSVIGTLLIYSGMMLLLLYKGSEPFNKIIESRQLFALIAIVMTVAGVVLQLLLCPAVPKKTELKKESLNLGDKK